MRRRAPGLSARDRAVLDLEREWGQSPHMQAQKMEAAHRELGLTPGGYALILNGLLSDPLAREYDATTIDRLRGVREVSHADPDDAHPLAEFAARRPASFPRSIR